MQIEAALEPPNRIDPVRGVPLWWHGDDAAAAEFRAAMR